MPATGGTASRWPPGWIVEHVTSTGSTNDDVVATAAHRPDRAVLVADHQAAGRGRLARRWDAPPGTNLLASMLFHVVPERPSELTRRVGLAAVAVAGGRAVLKWPNDVLVDEAKLAGILAQRMATGSVVVGIGMNVRWAPAGAARLGEDVDPLDVLASLLAAFDALPADIEPDYRAALSTLGRRVRIERPTEVVEGTAVDVDADGRLLVLADAVDGRAVTRRFDVGDVIHLRTCHHRSDDPR